MGNGASTPAAAPAISIVVRTVGRRDCLAEALASLARQDRRDFEAVVVDMGARPATPLFDAARRLLPAITVVRPARRLARPAALNAGIRAAAAPVIAILDEDNVYDPGHVGHLLDGAASTQADFVYTGVRHSTRDRDGRVIDIREASAEFDLHRLLFGNYIYTSGSAFRRSLWERIGGYDERFVVFEDWEFAIRAALAGRVVHLPVVSAESRKRTGDPAYSNFDFEIGAVRRCQAGVYWKHRFLYSPRMRRHLRRVYADVCRRRARPRPRIFSAEIGGWRLEAGADLLAWWWSDLTGRVRVGAT